VIAVRDLAWAAGFIEGEGCFSSINRNPCVSVVQVQREPLERLVAMFGGNLGVYRRNTGKHAGKEYNRWQVSGKKAAGIQMTLFCMMSPRRQEQIRSALDKWKSPVENFNRSKNRCQRGHEFTEGNTYIYPDGRRECKTCSTAYKRAYHVRKFRKNPHTQN